MPFQTHLTSVVISSMFYSSEKVQKLDGLPDIDLVSNSNVWVGLNSLFKLNSKGLYVYMSHDAYSCSVHSLVELSSKHWICF